MKILVVGLEHVGSLGWYIRDALLAMGHKVELFDYREAAFGWAGKGVFKNSILGRTAYKILYAKAVSRMNTSLIERAISYNPDVIIVQKGEIIFSQTVRMLKSSLKNTKLVVWHADSPFSALTSSSNIICSLPEYDVCFVFDPYYIPAIIRTGAGKAVYLPFACAPQVHKTVPLTEDERRKYGCDVVFIGTCQKGTNPKRSEILRHLSDFDLKIWGNGWHNLKDPQLNRCIAGGPVYGTEMVKLLNAGKIALNIHHGQSIAGVNMRTFETPACGCLLLTDELPELPKLFKCGDELVCYKNISDLRAKINYYLEHPDERMAIAKAGQARAHLTHTYVQRMEKMLELTMDK